MTENEQKVFDAILSTPKANIEILELIEKTGLSYHTIFDTLMQLRNKYHLVILGVGDRTLSKPYQWGYVKRVYFSKYDPNYETIMNGQ